MKISLLLDFIILKQRNQNFIFRKWNALLLILMYHNYDVKK